MKRRLQALLCWLGLHPWQVRMLIITGHAWCPRCGATGIFTPDGIISVQRPPSTAKEDAP